MTELEKRHAELRAEIARLQAAGVPWQAFRHLLNEDFATFCAIRDVAVGVIPFPPGMHAAAAARKRRFRSAGAA